MQTQTIRNKILISFPRIKYLENAPLSYVRVIITDGTLDGRGNVMSLAGVRGLLLEKAEALDDLGDWFNMMQLEVPVGEGEVIQY
jgi:hypothetical protein